MASAHKQNMLLTRHIYFLVVHLVGLMQMIQARPSLSADRILNQLSKRNFTSPSRKVDCDNIFMLIDSQIDLLKCLLRAYKFDEQEIVFPDSEESDEENYLLEPMPQIHGVPSCAKNGDTFCENVDTYPYDKVQMLLKKNNSVNNVFGVDVLPEELLNRVDLNEDRFLCEADHRLVFPKIGKTKDNTWQYIVNQGKSTEGYIQGIRIETCKYLGEPCELVNSIPSGYVTSCKQKYMYRRLLSVTNQGTTVNEFFELPSACCCSYRRDVNYLLRFGAAITPTKKKH